MVGLGAMTTLTLATLGLSLSVAQPLPDQLDILRGADTTPQIQLLLDSSCSMGWDPAPSVCTHYPTAQSTLRGSYQSGSTWYLSRVDQLKAALTGCRTAEDGVLDLWSSRVLFSIREFGGSRTGVLSPFDPTLANLASLETAVMNLPASGGTPLAPAYREAARYFDAFFNDGNTERCRQNYIVVMSDGVGNWGSPVQFDFVSGNTPVEVRDANYCFGSAGSCFPAPPYLDEAAEYLLVNDAGQPADVLSNVTGSQPIRTYTIGFQAPTAADALLRAMAASGDGQAYTATSYEQLSSAFEEIISSIVARARINFNAGTVQTDGLFSGNDVYLSVFRPTEDGHWLGSTKKYCVLPETPTDQSCLFLRDSATDNLVSNLRPVDIWTSSDQLEANAGGSGQVMLNSTFGVSDVTSAPPSNPLGRRSILTWRPDQSGYVSVNPSSLERRDTWTSERCGHHALMNALHGFSEQVADCAGGDMSPAAFDGWPIGDTVHGGTVLLQYTITCEESVDRCFAATVANDGMLHIYDARTGQETSAVIPAELWRPNTVAKHTLDQREDQPGTDTARRYYFDGRLYLHHVDDDGDGLIDPNESAALVAGLGRGGRGYYLFDVANFDGVFDDRDNPPRPLLADETTGFRHLGETWSAPWTGFLETSPGAETTVAVFPSGHLAELDAPDAPFAVLPAGPPLATSDHEGMPFSATCADMGIPPELCATPDPASFCPLLGLTCPSGTCSPCPLVDPADCATAGFAEPYCYDWPGAVLLPASAGIWARYPLDIAFGPYRYDDGARQGMAYRIRFSRFDLQPGDYLAIFDAEQVEVARLQGTLTATASPWIYDRSFSMRLVSDGVNDTAALGYTIEGIDIIRGPQPAAAGAVHRPSLYVVDLNRWNSATALTPPFASGAPGVFAAAPVGGDDRQAGALLARITSECDGVQGVDEVCVDRFTSADTADLRWMQCPISAEPAVYTEGGLLRAIYVGDECGQIWKAAYDIDGNWSVRRLLRLNNTDGDGYTVRGARSADYRKIFRRLELVVSSCPGTRAIGLYFGTGDIQSPASVDNLQDQPVSAFSGTVYGDSRDVVGVVWDTPLLPASASLDDLANMTDQYSLADPTAPGNNAGWFLELDSQERMLRDPLVFDGIAYFDVYRPVTGASECISAVGESRTLFMNNCTAEPLPTNGAGALTPNEQRTTGQRSDSTIGGGFLVVAPIGEDPVVTLGQNASGQANLPTREGRSALRLFLWRP